MEKNLFRKCLQIVLFLFGVSYGMMMMRFQIFPYALLRNTYHLIGPGTGVDGDRDSTEKYSQTNVEDLISISNQSDIKEKRDQLIQLLWGSAVLPNTLPSRVERNISDDRYSDIDSLRDIDKITIHMEYGLESIVYHFVPSNRSGQITYFLENGFGVIAFNMPLLGENNQPVISVPHIGRLKLTTHEQLKFATPIEGHPIKYFIEPVVTILNYLEYEKRYTTVSMVGISGGGWTTTLAAAIDKRISESFPVAGSYPIFLRSGDNRDWGDWEQTAPELYRNVNYLELYVLGATGNNRKQLQVINRYDSCCFGGDKWETYNNYVKSSVEKLGCGEFELFVDESHHEHKISKIVLGKIVKEIDGQLGTVQCRQ